MMSSVSTQVDESAVLTEALLNAAEGLGLTRAQLGRVVGRDRSRLKSSIKVDSKPGELALLLIRCYRSLFALVDGDPVALRHWMRVNNRATGGVPIEQVQTALGLFAVVSYLDAIRGKV